MAKSITIRDVPEYLRAQLIALARKPDPEVLMARVRARKAETGSRIEAEEILRHRDADRR